MDSDRYVCVIGDADDTGIYYWGGAEMIKVNIEPLLKDIKTFNRLQIKWFEVIMREAFGVR